MAYPGSIDAMQFGQMGGVYLDLASTTITPASGKVFSAITMLEETQFSALVAKESNICFNSDTAGPGTNGQVLENDQVFPRGVTIYGRWTSLSLHSGAVIAYQGV